jgi:hypothetical protein
MRAQIKSWTVLAYDFLSPKNQGNLIVVSGQVSCHLTMAPCHHKSVRTIVNITDME